MNAPSLTGFLEITGAKYRLFDLGTQLRKLSNKTLLHLDEGQKYPYPHLGFGWLAIFTWNGDLIEQNSLWFLKLPLDEQGILSAAVHSDLVNRFYRAFQTSDRKERQRLLTDHPYQFKPDNEKMAALHALASHQLALPPSFYHQSAAQFYLNDDREVQWQQIGVQGIADIVTRLSNTELESLNNRIASLEDEPLIALMRQLEHFPLHSSTIDALISRSQNAPNHSSIVNACLKSASQSQALKLVEPIILERLSACDFDLEFLLIIITRYHYLFDNIKTATTVLDHLAQMADSDGFNRVVTNLAMQTGMEGIIMTILRSASLTENLANALSRLIQSQRANNENH